jgi:antitoxin ParD1/3/4
VKATANAAFLAGLRERGFEVGCNLEQVAGVMRSKTSHIPIVLTTSVRRALSDRSREGRDAHVDNCCHSRQDADMSRQTMSFALPESMREYIDARVAAGNYGNTSEYIRDLVRRDQEEQAKKRLRDLIEEGLASGPGHRRTKADDKKLLAIARGEID